MSQVLKVIGYQLAWLARDGRGEVLLYINQDNQPDITIKVANPGDLVAWDELLNQKGVINVNWQNQTVFGPKKQI